MRKTETGMGGLREERFGGSGRGVDNGSEGWGVETCDGAALKWDHGRKKKGRQKSKPCVGASLTPTSGIQRRKTRTDEIRYCKCIDKYWLCTIILSSLGCNMCGYIKCTFN